MADKSHQERTSEARKYPGDPTSDLAGYLIARREKAQTALTYCRSRIVEVNNKLVTEMKAVVNATLDELFDEDTFPKTEFRRDEQIILRPAIWLFYPEGIEHKGVFLQSDGIYTYQRYDLKQPFILSPKQRSSSEDHYYLEYNDTIFEKIYRHKLTHLAGQLSFDSVDVPENPVTPPLIEIGTFTEGSTVLRGVHIAKDGKLFCTSSGDNPQPLGYHMQYEWGLLYEAMMYATQDILRKQESERL